MTPTTPVEANKLSVRLGVAVVLGAVLVVGVILFARVYSKPDAEVLTPGDLAELAEQMRVRDAALFRGGEYGSGVDEYVTGDYVRRDGTVGAYYASYQHPLPADMVGVLEEHYVPVEVVEQASASELLVAAAGMLGLLAAFVWLLGARRQGRGAFDTTSRPALSSTAGASGSLSPDVGGAGISAVSSGDTGRRGGGDGDPDRHGDPDRLRAALGRVLVGGLVMVIDLNVDGFDLVNDVVGWLLVYSGVAVLRRAPVGRRHAQAMSFVRLAVLAFLAWSVLVQLEPRAQDGVLAEAMNPLGLVALMAFCLATGDLAVRFGLAARRDWVRSLWLVTGVWGGAYVVVSAAWLVGEVAGASVTETSVEDPVLLAGLFLVLALPVAHLVWSIVRTRRELRTGSTAPPALVPRRVG